MKRRRLLKVLLIPMLAAGCTPPAGQSPQPSVGAEAVNAAYPAIGARWRVRVTEREFFRETVEDRDITATAVDFLGRRGYGMMSPTITIVRDPATFNVIGTVQGGKAATTYTPEAGPFSWPLWVGKSWEATYSFTDFVYGRVWPVAKSRARVAAIEDITVPAGTFKAFRIEYSGGIGTESVPTRRNPGNAGIESNDVYWYAPGAKIVVKSVVERLGSHYRGAGRTTSELLSPPR